MWRAVEAQHRVSTSKLVQNLDDQQLLETLVEQAKPPLPQGLEGRHYLIATPFRYPPLRHGSRFGRTTERGIFYASRETTTALAETAYYRLVFIQASAADLTPVTTHHTLFKVAYGSAHGIDLTAPPFSRHHESLTAVDDYSATQALGSAMRKAGVGLFRFASARQPGGINVAAFEPAAIASREPQDRQSWALVASSDGVSAIDQRLQHNPGHYFAREQFLFDGQLPSPAT